MKLSFYWIAALIVSSVVGTFFAFGAMGLALNLEGPHLCVANEVVQRTTSNWDACELSAQFYLLSAWFFAIGFLPTLIVSTLVWLVRRVRRRARKEP